MPERDGYIPGVPCWVDTNQPDPAAAIGVHQVYSQVAACSLPSGIYDAGTAIPPVAVGCNRHGARVVAMVEVDDEPRDENPPT